MVWIQYHGSKNTEELGDRGCGSCKGEGYWFEGSWGGRALEKSIVRSIC